MAQMTNTGDTYSSRTPGLLKTASVAKLLFLPSQGEVKGFVDMANPAKSVYFGNTAVQNADGSYNINNVEIALRLGTDDQTVIPGFTGASTAYNVATKVTVETPVVYTTTTAAVDAVRVTVRIPALYKYEDNGNPAATPLSFQLFTKQGSDPYVMVRNVTLSNETSTDVFDLDYLIERPAAPGIFSVKMERVTPDNTSLSIQNDVYFQIATEIQNVNLSYPKNALVAIKTTSENAGTNPPTISFAFDGLLVSVPSNYTVATRTYSGAWDGLFKPEKEWCNNPAFVLYEMLINEDWGLGNIVSASDIDQYSFYEAAQYCDELVPALDATGAVSGTEPRYRFNHQYMDSADTFQFLQNMAATFSAVVVSVGSTIKVVQDRPTEYSRIITNSNVEGGLFEYASTNLDSRYTAAIVWWNDESQNGILIPAYYEDPVATARYPHNVKEVTGVGVRSHGQAMRMAKRIVESGLANNETVTFKVGYKNALMEVGEVVAIMDTAYAQSNQEAVVVSSTSSTITFDRALPVTSGDTIDVVRADNTGYDTRTVTSTGTLSTVSYSGAALDVLPGAEVLLTTSSVSPRQFRINELKEEQLGIHIVNGIFYDPNLYARVDDTPEGPVVSYQAQPDGYVVSPVSEIVFTEESVMTPEDIPQRYLVASWSPVANELVVSYRAWGSYGNGPLVDLGVLTQPFFRYAVPVSGFYTVVVYAMNVRGKVSLPTTGVYTVDLETPLGGSELLDVTDLYVKGTTGTTFTGSTLTVTAFDPNVSNEGPVQKGYLIRVMDAIDSSVYRTEFIVRGTASEYTYDLIKQDADNPNNPQRNVRIEVRVQDTFNRVTTGTSAVFSNPPPEVPDNLVLTPLPGGAEISFDPSIEPDVIGYVYWASLESGFTPLANNRVAIGTETRKAYYGLEPGITIYVRFAAYDSFSTLSDIENGTNLILSDELSVTPTAAASAFKLINSGMGFVFDNIDDTTSDSPPITFTVESSGDAGTVIWTAVAYGEADYTGYQPELGYLELVHYGDPNIRVLTPDLFTYYSGTATVRVTAALGDLQDTVTIYRVNGGSDALQMGLTNESVNLPATAAGVVSDYDAAFTNVLVYKGVTDVTYDWEFSKEDTNCTSELTGVGTGTVTVTVSDLSADQGSVLITAAKYIEPNYVYLNKTFSLTKSKAGINATRLTLTGTGFAFVFDNVNSVTSASPTLSFSANLLNVEGDVTWLAQAYTVTDTLLGEITLGGTGNTNRTLTSTQFNSLGATSTRYVKITASLDDLSDSNTVYRGDGASTLVQAALSNEAVTLSANSAGVVSSYTNSGTGIAAFAGVNQLTYDGVGTSNGTWTVVATPTNITTGSITDSGLSATVGAHSAMTADQASIEYEITGKDFDGVAFTISKTQSFAKSRTGARGSLTGYAFPQYGISSSSWDDQYANRTIHNMLNGATSTAALATTDHLVNGDTVTLRNSDSSFVQTRFWTGTAWVQT